MTAGKGVTCLQFK